MLTGFVGEGLNNGSIIKIADFSKEKAEMGHVYQSGEKGSECCPRPSEEPKGLSSERFLGWRFPCLQGLLPPQQKLRKVYICPSVRASYLQKR